VNIDAILLSEYAALTDGEQSLTIVRVWNAMASMQFPVVMPSMALSMVVHAHPSEAGTDHKLDIVLKNTKREILAKLVEDLTFTLAGGDGKTSLPGIPIRHYLVHRMVNVQFGSPGSFAFEVFIDGTYHASTAFHIGDASD
jgi:Family of unknown function (DUF6941)